ncbi:Peroxidasin like protein [Argiope bruennichi]|uniref:Peroxidasin like protein n=1 Tax=Argiope bruennichi TaxID=94029 RepID=A0A8T0E6G5_ARGBR|nr:Peroxidasin like protein [Argiope bruennichi]
MTMLRTSIVTLLLTGLLSIVTAICPPEILTRPCTCSNIDGNFLRCENITETNVLNGVFRRTTGIFFNHLQLVKVSIESIPARSLLDKQIKTIGIVDSNLTKLFDKTPPPSNILRAINLMNVKIQDSIQWNQFKSLKSLILFLAIGVEIPVLDNTFKNNVNKNLTYFALSNTSTVHIVDGVLSELTNLEDVKIQKNPLATYKRNYFSRPSNIIVLDLDGNQIETLPADAFSQMPRLQALSLKNNKISTIPDGVFSQINHKLSYLELEDNPLNCDCGFKWIISNKPKYSLTGNCATPENLKGKTIKDLESADLTSCH